MEKRRRLRGEAQTDAGIPLYRKKVVASLQAEWLERWILYLFMDSARSKKSPRQYSGGFSCVLRMAGERLSKGPFSGRARILRTGLPLREKTENGCCGDPLPRRRCSVCLFI